MHPPSPATAPPPPPPPEHDQKRILESHAEPKRPQKLSRSVSDEGEVDDEAEANATEEGEDSSTMRNPRAQRYLLAVEYIGTRFSGSARQPNQRTVVGTLEEAFCKFTGPVSVVCSSRTDAGVHALSNVFHVDVVHTTKRKPGEVLPPHEPRVVRRAVNHFLQSENDINLIDVRCVPADFHARFKALERTYFYRLLSGPEPLSLFEKGRAWHVPEELDIPAMKKACNALVGHHDFSSFRASGCQANSPIRTLDELHVCEVVPSLYFPSGTERRKMESNGEDIACYNMLELESSTVCSNASHNEKCSLKSTREFGQRPRHRCYVITARSRAFLYHQVRLLVGVLKSVGTGDLTISDVERILNAKTVTAASPMAPACGLYLGNVKYEIPEDSGT